jgi:hypothetical protein
VPTAFVAFAAVSPTALVALSAALLTADVAAGFDEFARLREDACLRELGLRELADFLVEPRERAWGFCGPEDRFDAALVLV